MLDTQILRLPVEAIAPNPYQPRTDFAPEPLAELADSIRRHGILQPLTIRRTKTGWELVAGELRLSPDCRKLLVENGLSERHARALLRLDDPEERLSALRHIIRAGLNVAQAEQYVGRRLEALQATPPAGRRTFILKDVRLFLNSLDRGLRLVREAGIGAESRREDTEDAILLTIRSPKAVRRG